MQEFEHYFVEASEYHKDIPPPDVSLNAIRAALFSFFGIKEPESEQQKEEKIKHVATATVTEAEMRAYYAAGMPSPFGKWLAGYRKGQAR